MDDSTRKQPGVLPVFRTREQTRSFYDKISSVYDLLADRSEAPVRNRGLEMLDAQPGETILEIGSGTGRCLASIGRAVEAHGLVVGVDLSQGMLAQSSRFLAGQGLADRVLLECADATALPFGNAVFDAVFTSFTLELFDTPEIPRVLAQCRRVLRPAGRILVVGMSREGEPDVMVRMYEWTHRHFPNFVDCRPIYVRRAMEQAGFRVQASERMQMWLPVEIVLASAD